MWRIVCVGPGPLDHVRRVVDRGPLHPDRARANQIADFLRATGLYESVKVVGSTVKAAAVASADPDFSFNPADGPGAASAGKSLDDLSSALDEEPAQAS